MCFSFHFLCEGETKKKNGGVGTMTGRSFLCLCLCLCLMMAVLPACAEKDTANAPVFEDGMGLNAVSASGKAVFEDEMGCRWGRSVPESVEWSVPELVEGPTHARHSGLDPESPT